MNNLIESIDNFNAEEAIYWAHLIKQQKKSTSCPLTSIFKGFRLTNQELSAILTELIWETLKNEDFPIVIINYKAELTEGLKVNDENVNKLCLRIIFDLGIGKGHEIDEEMLKNVLNLMNSNNYSVSSYLAHLIIKFNDYSNYSKYLLEMYYNTKSDDSIIKFRYLELFQKLNISNPQLFNTFFEEIKGILLKPENDLLFTANVLQIIQDCIDRKEQFELFLNEGIIDDIIRLITNNNSDVLVSKSLDIIANCAINQCFDSEFINSKGLNRIIYNIEPATESSVFCSCSIASLCPNDNETISNLFHTSFMNGNSEIQLAALHGLGIYFKSTSSLNHLALLTNLNSYGWFNSWLPERLSSTFDEQKSASYYALKSIITSSPDSFKFILSNSNLFANLLDRSLDSSLLGLKWKYGIIEDIKVNSDLFGCLNDPLKEMVVNYLRNGVTFIPKASQVAYEGYN